MRKNYNFGLTLGTASNRDDAGDAYGIYLRKQFHSNNMYSYEIKDAYHIPTKKAIKEYGESNLHVVIFKNCMPAAKSKLKGFRWVYEAEQTIWMPLLEFKKWYGSIPTMNSGGTKAKKI
jgi:hypothetical protein